MQAFIIKPENKTIEPIDIKDENSIIELIGFDTIIADEIDDNGDKLYFDEECFLRGTQGRFQVDNLIPVSGTGIVIGSGDDSTLSDVKTTIEAIQSRTKFL